MSQIFVLKMHEKTSLGDTMCPVRVQLGKMQGGYVSFV